MACKYEDNFTVPLQFPEVYHDFLQSIIKDKPNDIIDYGFYYFEAKQLVKIFFFVSIIQKLGEGFLIY